MKKRIPSMVLVLSVIASLITAMPVSASANINIGDYVQMGQYYGMPILWRCVDIDENGPLMLSDRIICLKPFDASGTNTSGSHGRGYYYNGQQGCWRQQYGSNYWADSNIRDWLNSTASAGNVVWSCGNPPDNSHVLSGHNDYASEAGFLSNFSDSERNAIKTVTQKSLLDGYEHSGSSNKINSNYHRYDYDIYDVVQNYDTAYSELVTDRMFLLDVKQINTVYNNGSILGSDYYIGIPTAEAVANSEFKDSSLNATTKWWSWLGSPNANGSSVDVRNVDSFGSVDSFDAYGGHVGVRPAFYLNLSSLNLKYGSGTSNEPYSVEPRKIVTKPTATDIVYGQVLSESVLSNGSVKIGEETVEGTFTWKNGDKILPAGKHTEKVVFTPTDTTITDSFEIDVELTVLKAEMNVNFPNFAKTDYVIGTKLSEIEINESNEYGTFRWEKPNQTIANGENICKMVFVPNDTNNYDTTSKEYIFTNTVLENTIVLADGDSIQAGSGTTRNVTVSSNKKIYAVVFDVEYPLDVELTSISKKDFAYIDISEKTVKNGVNVATITAQYSDSAVTDENVIYTLLALNFNVSQSETVGEKAITLKNVSFYDDGYNEISVMKIENSKIDITPKLIEGIKISGNSTVYDSGKFIVNITPNYVTDKSVTWTVSDESIAAISQDGTLTALKNGTVTVTATANDGSGKKDSKTVNVYFYAKINSIASDIGEWNRKFNPTVYDYKIFVGADTESIGITTSFSEGNLKLNGTTLMLNKVKKNVALENQETVITLNRAGVTDNINSVYTITIIKAEMTNFDVECSKTESKYNFDIAVSDDVGFDEGVLVLAGYKDGVLGFVEVKDVNSTSRSKSFEFANLKYDTFRIMLLDSLYGIKPLAEPMEITDVPNAEAPSITIDTVLESKHNYDNNTEETKSYTYDGECKSIDVTFTSDTYSEVNFDYIYIYDANDNQIGKYSGTSLAGKTINIPGNAVKIKLVSDENKTYYGYRTESIVVNR